MEEGLEQIIVRLRDRLGKEDRAHLYNNKPCTYIEFGDSKTKVSNYFIFSKKTFQSNSVLKQYATLRLILKITQYDHKFAPNEIQFLADV